VYTLWRSLFAQLAYEYHEWIASSAHNKLEIPFRFPFSLFAIAETSEILLNEIALPTSPKRRGSIVLP
jgi:hypothetical protein